MHWANTICFFESNLLVDSSHHFLWLQLWGLTCNSEASRMARHRFAAWAPSQTLRNLRSCSKMLKGFSHFEPLNTCITEKTYHILVKPYSASVATGCENVGMWLSRARETIGKQSTWETWDGFYTLSKQTTFFEWSLPWRIILTFFLAFIQFILWHIPSFWHSIWHLFCHSFRGGGEGGEEGEGSNPITSYKI